MLLILTLTLVFSLAMPVLAVDSTTGFNVSDMILLNIKLFYALFAVLCLIIFNFILAVIESIQQTEFKASDLPNFLRNHVLFYFVPTLILCLAAQINYQPLVDNAGVSVLANYSMVGFAWAAIGTIAYKMLKYIASHLSVLMGLNINVSE